MFILKILIFFGRKNKEKEKRLAAAAAEALWVLINQRMLHFSTSKVSSLDWLKPYCRTPSKVCDT